MISDTKDMRVQDIKNALRKENRKESQWQPYSEQKCKKLSNPYNEYNRIQWDKNRRFVMFHELLAV